MTRLLVATRLRSAMSQDQITDLPRFQWDMGQAARNSRRNGIPLGCASCRGIGIRRRGTLGEKQIPDHIRLYRLNLEGAMATKTTAIGAALALAMSVAGGHLFARLTAQDAPRTCQVSASKHPELMPDYFVWEVYFRTTTDSAKGDTEGLVPSPGQQFRPDGVTAGAKQVGVPAAEYLAFLQVGDAALKKVDALRASVPANAPEPDVRRRREDEIDVILDASDEIARRVSPAVMRALRRNSPARGSVFDFPCDN
jgi:hypothetical protein